MGAWIETSNSETISVFADVAPHVGAWIETNDDPVCQNLAVSHPTWVRGLKPMALYYVIQIRVAPHVGAWIETQKLKKLESSQKSHPTWVRGLKRGFYDAGNAWPHVAPHVGAWIETH